MNRNGFAKSGQEVKLWDFVDHGNLYGDEGVKAILQEWWIGGGPTATSWHFNLKANADDAILSHFCVFLVAIL